MRRDLLWLLALLTAASFHGRAHRRANPHVSFVVQRMQANWEVLEITVDGRYDPPYLMARSDDSASRYVVRKLGHEDYLTILEQAEADGLWHTHPANSKGHWGCLAYPLSGPAGPESGHWDQQKFAEHFFGHPAIQEVTAQLKGNDPK
ncbi:MAG: hypothetical protein KF760_30505 [Candidatus Eremiobacteraeota bacterium]|nr:hypothetical protein [Candidatus Eremiobacteraeota bacterium]MCW5872193.1 hypothetical protein [Candidatus Eremiobacteraeota bacterium]